MVLLSPSDGLRPCRLRLGLPAFPLAFSTQLAPAISVVLGSVGELETNFVGNHIRAIPVLEAMPVVSPASECPLGGTHDQVLDLSLPGRTEQCNKMIFYLVSVADIKFVLHHF